MLPYAPLHHVLLADLAALGVEALVLTSGNVSDEPIAFRDGDARERLESVADAFLVHDRPIETRTDDSVVRGVAVGAGRRPLTLRRSRGYVPASIGLPVAAPEAAARMRRPAQGHVLPRARAPRLGQPPHRRPRALPGPARLPAGHRAISSACSRCGPSSIAHDLHPDYASTAYALELDGVELTGVQHHHAHLAACLAEHGLEGPAVGAIYDGSGYGTDGTIWGGEILVGDLVAFERVASLRAVRMPGGERAVREPWRMACAWLASAGGERPHLPEALAGIIDRGRWDAVASIGESAACLAGDLEHGAPLRRRGRALRAARAGVATRVKLQLSLRLAPRTPLTAGHTSCRSATRAGGA